MQASQASTTLGVSPHAQSPLPPLPSSFPRRNFQRFLTPTQKQQHHHTHIAAASGHAPHAPQASPPHGGKRKRQTHRKRKNHKKTKRNYRKYK